MPVEVAHRAELGADGSSSPFARPRSEAVAALGPAARSILVPGLIMVLLVVGGLVAVAGGTVGVLRSLADAEVFEDTGEVGLSPSSVIDCAAELRTVRNAAEVYRSTTGRYPTSTDDLVPDYIDREPQSYRIETRSGQIIIEPEEGSTCAGGDARERRTRDAVDAVADSASLALLVAGLLSLGAIAGYQGYWLATAYRCLPTSRQQHPTRHAYSPLVVYAVGACILGAVGAALLGSGTLYDEPIASNLLISALQVVFLVFVVRAVLRAFAMLGDVTFHFCGGHYLTSRALRICLYAFLVAPIASVLIGQGLYQAGLSLAGEVVVAGGLAIGYVLAPAVGLVSYVLAVALAVTGVERTLGEAARDLTALRRDAAARSRLAADARA